MRQRIIAVALVVIVLFSGCSSGGGRSDYREDTDNYDAEESISTDTKSDQQPDFSEAYKGEVLEKYNELYPDNAIAEEQVEFNTKDQLTIAHVNDMNFVICVTDGAPCYMLQSEQEPSEDTELAFFEGVERFINAIYYDQSDDEIASVLEELMQGEYPYDNAVYDVLGGQDIRIKGPTIESVPEKKELTYEMICFKNF